MVVKALVMAYGAAYLTYILSLKEPSHQNILYLPKNDMVE
jgi:hypothetical protein